MGKLSYLDGGSLLSDSSEKNLFSGYSLSNLAKRLIKFYLVFAVFYPLIYYFYPQGGNLSDKFAVLVIVSRDVLWFGFCIWLIIKLRGNNSDINNLSTKTDSHYIHMRNIFKWGYMCFFAIISTHILHKAPLEILQHDIRNTMMYVLIVFFVYSIGIKKEDIKDYFSLLIRLGIIVGVWGVITAIFFKPLTWQERAISTLGNPNTLALFMDLILLLLLPKLLEESRNISKFRYIAYIVCFLCLLYTCSLSILVFILGSTIIILANKGLNLKGITWLLSHSIILCMVFTIFLQLGLMSIFTYKLVFSIREIKSISPVMTTKINEIEARNDKIARVLNGVPQRYTNSVTERFSSYRGVKAYIENPKTSILDILFGNYSLSKYSTYDNQYLNLFYNNGILVTIMVVIIFLKVAVIGFKKYLLFMKNEDYDTGNIFLSLSTFLVLTLFVGFNFSAFLNRFPLNFLLYFICGLLLVVNPAKINSPHCLSQ